MKMKVLTVVTLAIEARLLMRQTLVWPNVLSILQSTRYYNAAVHLPCFSFVGCHCGDSRIPDYCWHIGTLGISAMRFGCI